MPDNPGKDKGTTGKEVPSLIDVNNNTQGDLYKASPTIIPSKEVPSLLGGLEYNQEVLPASENQFRKIDVDNFDKEGFDEKFSQTYLSDEPYSTKLAKTQSNLDRLGNLAGRIVTNTLGGTIQGIGSLAELPFSIYDEIKGEDADFNNSFMELGRKVEDFGQKNLPNYRLNPGKSWDVTDPAWWFEGVESAFSTLQFIVPTMGAVKGVGALAKLMKVEQAINKIGGNAEKIKYFGKIGTGAVTARNAENLVESYSVRQDVKQGLLQEWNSNPEAFEKAKETDAAIELGKLGKEVNQENLSNFIAGKAGWRSYFINSANVIFDAVQLAPIFKGFNPNTRLGRFGTSSEILEANAKLLNPTAKVTGKIDKLFDIMNPMLSGIGRSSSEGLEEAINYIGTEEGKNYAKQLLDKDKSTFTTRMSNYLKSGDLYESAFWGIAGGSVFEGASKGLNKALALTKGNKSNTETDYRIAEITNRLSLIQEASNEIKKVIDNKEITNEDKKNTLAKIKSELSLDLGLHAAQVGNVDLLLQQVGSKEFKDKLVEQGIAEEGDVEKAVAKTQADILLAERLYTKYYNSFQTAEGSELVRSSLINRSVVADYFVEKNKERITKLNNELGELKTNQLNKELSSHPAFESGLYLEGLKQARKYLNSYLDTKGIKGDELLSERGKAELKKIEDNISHYEGLKDNKPNLSSLNPDILDKQAEIIFAEGVNNVQSSKIDDLRKPENIKKINDDVKQAQKKAEEDEFNIFKTEVDEKVNKDSITSSEIVALKNKNLKNRDRLKYLDEKYKIVKDREDAKARQQEVQVVTNQLVKEVSELEQALEGLPEFKTTKIDVNKVAPSYKKAIDKFVAEKDYWQLRGLVTDEFESSNPNEAVYARNKVQELRAELNKVPEIVQNNNPVNTGVEEGFELDENAQSQESTGTTIDQLTNGGTKDEQNDTGTFNGSLYLRTNGEPATRGYIPLFDTTLKNYKSHKYFDVANGNIRIHPNHEPLIRALFKSDLQAGSEVEVQIDKENPYYDRNKTNKDTVPIKVSYKGTTLMYIATVPALQKAIDRMIAETAENGGKLSEKISELQLELTHIKKLREDINLQDKVFKTTVTYKGNGTVISRGKSKTGLRSVKGLFNDFYSLNPASSLNKTTVFNLSNKNDFFGASRELKHGVIYGSLESANGTKIPVPLFVNKINLNQAKQIQGDIDKLLDQLNEGKTSDHQSVRDIKDSIARYIKVDRASQFDKPVGFRVYPRGKNAEGEDTDARVEFSFISRSGKRRICVVKKSTHTGEDWVAVFEDDKKLAELSIHDEDFLNILQQKYHNVSYELMQSDKSFKTDKKTYPSYKDYLIDEEIIQTDVAQVVNNKGEVLSNFFGFDNDFSLEIATNILGEAKSTGEDKTTNFSNLFLISPYEKELTTEQMLTDDTSYRDNYSLYSKSSVDLRTTLDEILKNPLNDNIKEVATFLKSNISKTSTTIQKVEHVDDNDPALFLTKENTILVNGSRKMSEAFFQQVVLHEAVHALTINTIYSNIKSTSKAHYYSIQQLDEIQFKDNCPQYVKKFVSDIIIERNNAVAQITKKYGATVQELIKKDTNRFYGLTNIQEFISESMTNPLFRNELRELEEGKSFLARLYNGIIALLNKVFGTKYSYKEVESLQRSIGMIKNFVERTDKVPDYVEVDQVVYKRITDEFNNEFPREEISEIINTFQGVILNVIKNKKLDAQDLEKEILDENKDTVRKLVEDLLTKYHENLCPDTCKDKVGKILRYYNNFFRETIRRINRDFKVTVDDVSDIKDFQEIRKDWEDSAAHQLSSQDRITNQIKMFVRTIPELNSTEVSYTTEGEPIWDKHKSTITGMNKYVDFHTIYPYMVRNLIGARTPADIITRLRKMGKVYPSFAYMAHELQKDANLLAQYESTMARKYTYDSYVTFLSNYDSGLVIRVDNEAKENRHDIILANSWNDNLSKLIDSLDTDEKRKAFKDKVSSLYTNISVLQNSIDTNSERISQLTWDLANTLGINLSISAIKAQLDTLRNWNDFKILNTLDYIASSAISGKKNNSWANLNYLADIESIFTFDIVENSVLSIDGKPLYTIRNPHYLSNWFTLAKSETAEGKQEFEQLLKSYSEMPDMEMSNWLWNEKDKDGFLNYKIENKKKVATTVNWDYVNRFAFHNYAGAKETVHKTVQKYTDFSEKDWMLINLINHIQGSKKRGFIQVPTLIPSDSSNMYTLEVLKVPLKDGDWKNGKLDRSSDLFQAVRNTARQEIRRIQQATQELFDIVDNNLVIKADLDVSKLQQYFHYGKEHVLNSDGTINLQETLLNKDGSPKGKAFYFQNLSVRRGNKVLTLNDIDGIKINHHLGIGTVSGEVASKIDDFVDEFISQQVSNALKDYSSLESSVAEKHDAIGDGSFENLIAEYILNQYIANVEQFNFFQGNIAEYKDKVDTNKRAKQMFAPGVGLSEEAMKMELENNSWSDGKTFRAATIKDVKTTSATIDFIINTVKNKLVDERPNSYTKNEIADFNPKSIKSSKPQSELEKDVYKIAKGYLSINAGDAQGYNSIDRYESIIRGLGRYNKDFEKAFTNVRSGKQLTTQDIKVLQPLKGFYYGREYDPALGRFVSVQIKYSTIPLIPQLVQGTNLELLMDTMKEKALDEVFFESAHKVGAKMIFNVADGDVLVKEKLDKIEATTYFNKNWQLQLDVPEHLVDEQNLLATQIAKLIIANLSDAKIYEVNGQKYRGEELKKHYFKVLGDNIIESAEELLETLGVEKTDTGFKVSDQDIRKTLMDEVNRRGLSENYEFAIELNDKDEFKLPLFVNNMSSKWEAILTSLFTKKITKQKMPGASAVLASRLFLDVTGKISETSQSNNKDIVGIQWSKEKEGDHTLKSYHDDNGIKVVEVLLGAWSSKLYDKKGRLSIDEVPEDIRTMLGYRIPTDKKSTMVVFKVVGFLPEESKGLIITPDDIVTQMGSDFDIDKLFIINQNFYRKDNGEFVTPKLGKEEDEYKSLIEERKALYKELYGAEDYAKYIPESIIVDEIFSVFGNESIDEAKRELEKAITDVNRRIRAIVEKNDKEEYVVRKNGSKHARENEIFNIYKSILTNPYHLKELISPTDFQDFKDVKNEIDEIFDENESNINPLTEEGQRTFRRRNISGRALKGIAANFNAFGSIAQNTRMELNESLAFKFKFDLKKYNVDDLEERYGDNLEIKDGYAYVKFTKLGWNRNGDYLNANNELILEVASQGISAAVDIVKDPTFDSFNATTYTYPVFHTMLLAGVPVREAAMFLRQPIIKYLNDYYFEKKSLLGDDTGNQIETLKRFYQTQLAIELVKDGTSLKDYPDVFKTLKRRKESGTVNSMDKKYLIYVKRDDTNKLLGYNPDELDFFSVEELKTQLEINAKGVHKLEVKDRINYLKTQLQILEHFNTYKKAGEGVQDLVKVTKVDGLGAGPSMSVTSDLIRTINRLDLNARVLINNIPAVQRLYPTHFGLAGESVYSVLENYLNYSNKLSVAVLQGLFISQSNSFKNVNYTINGLQKRSLTEDEIKNLNKFLSTSILQDFEKFQGISKERILGIGSDVVANPDVNFETFRNLSVANKVSIIQQRNADYLKENTQHVLNFLQPKISNDDITKNKYHKIDVVFYKNEFTDDNLSDSILKMYESGDEFQKDLATDLVNYTYVSSGLTYGLNSFSKVIPNELLYNWGLGDFLRKAKITADTSNLFGNSKIVDQYFKNNWTSLPVVKTAWEYKTNGEGRLEIKEDEEGNQLTKNDTPIWTDDRGLIAITKKRFGTISEDTQNSPFLVVAKGQTRKLFKKYVQEVVDEENQKVSYKDNFGSMIYYYEVNKLGKDGISEFTDISIFADNNSEFVEQEIVSRIEDIISKTDESSSKDNKGNSLNLNNTPSDKKDKIKKDCDYGN